jgi:hypothetical protein
MTLLDLLCSECTSRFSLFIMLDEQGQALGEPHVVSHVEQAIVLTGRLTEGLILSVA